MPLAGRLETAAERTSIYADMQVLKVWWGGYDESATARNFGASSR